MSWIEYKAPHEFPLAQITAGLKGEIRPGDEIIDKEGDDFDFHSKSLVAAVITQLFSYIIAKGVQHGYVFDGEAIIFLYIPNDDPSMVCYHLFIPHIDFQENDLNRLHRTSVAQMLAFVLGALVAELPGQSWHDAAVQGYKLRLSSTMISSARFQKRSQKHLVPPHTSRAAGKDLTAPVGTEEVQEATAAHAANSAYPARTRACGTADDGLSHSQFPLLPGSRRLEPTEILTDLVAPLKPRQPPIKT